LLVKLFANSLSVAAGVLEVVGLHAGIMYHLENIIAMTALITFIAG
jgi:hypothetical protein